MTIATGAPKLNAQLGQCLLECKNIDLYVGYKPLLKQVSFQLFAGEALALLGPNGLGKTTLLRVCAGISQAQDGSVVVQGEQIWPQRSASFEHGCCFLASQPALLGEHSVGGNLEFMMNSFGKCPTWNDIHQALALVGLQGREKQQARTLSTGQKRRLTLAFLELYQPTVVLADEPTNGLDLQGVELCLSVFAKLQQQGTAVCIATHDTRLIEFCSRRISLEDFLPGRQQKNPEKNKILLQRGVFS